MGDSSHDVKKKTKEPPPTGVFISPCLQKRIIDSFNDSQLQNRWEQHQKELLVKSEQFQNVNESNFHKIEREKKNIYTKSKLLNDELDHKLEQHRNLIQDQIVSIEYDLGKLNEKYQQKQERKYHVVRNTCIEEKEELIKCWEEDDNCKEFMDILDGCVKNYMRKKKM